MTGEPKPIRRRPLLGGLATTAASLALPRIGEASLLNVPLDHLDPFGPPDLYYDKLRSAFNRPKDAADLAKRLWAEFNRTGNGNYGHWAIMYIQLWWQSLPGDQGRIRASKIGKAMADKLTVAMPESAAGPYWSAVFFGFEALVRGVLDSLQMVPDFLRKFDEAQQRDPSYLMGSVYMAKAKAYTKLPAFPMSVGSLDKAFEYLDKAKPFQAERYAYFYIVLAEAELQRNGPEAALAALEGIKNVCPSDVQSRYTYEMANILAEKLRAALAADTYNRYTWDPLLEPVMELKERKFVPPKLC